MDNEPEYKSKAILLKHIAFFKEYIEKYENTVFDKQAGIFRKILKAIVSDRILTTDEITKIDELCKKLKKQVIINQSRVSPPSSSKAENQANNNEVVSLEDISESNNTDKTIEEPKQNLREVTVKNISSDETQQEKIVAIHKRKPKKLKSSSESEGPDDDIPQLKPTLKRRRIIEPHDTSDEEVPCTSRESKRRHLKKSRNSTDTKKIRQSSDSRVDFTLAIADAFAKKAGVQIPGRSSNEMPRELKFLYHDIHRDPDKEDVLTADKDTRIRKKVDYREKETIIEDTETFTDETASIEENIYSSETTSVKTESIKRSTTPETLPELSETDHAFKVSDYNSSDDEEEDSLIRQYCLEDFNMSLFVKKLKNVPQTVKIVDGKIVPLPPPICIDLTTSDEGQNKETKRAESPIKSKNLNETPQKVKGYNLGTPSKSSLIQKAQARISNLSFLKCSGGYQYQCNYDSCSMYYTSRDSFKSHLSTRHIDTKWDGFCKICNFKVSNKTSFLDEFGHMINHIDGKQSKPTARKSTRKLSFNTVEKNNNNRNEGELLIKIPSNEIIPNTTLTNLENESSKNIATVQGEDNAENILLEEINLSSITDTKNDETEQVLPNMEKNLNLQTNSEEESKENQDKIGNFDEKSEMEKEKLSVPLENSTTHAIVIPDSLESVNGSTFNEVIETPDSLIDTEDSEKRNVDDLNPNSATEIPESLNDSNEATITNEEQDARLCETKSDIKTPTVAIKPLLKLRRLSGDKLSFSNEPTQSSHPSQLSTVDSISKPSPKIVFSMNRVSLSTSTSTLIKPLNSERRNTLPESHQIGNVVEKPKNQTTDSVLKIQSLTVEKLANQNLSKEAVRTTSVLCSTTFQQKNVLQSSTSLENNNNAVPTTSEIFLRPWVKINSYKTKIFASKMLQESCLKTFYKCMHQDCDYHTNDSVGFSNHLMKEKGTKKCSYCAYETDQVDKLISHIQQTHGTSSFACNLCFFRAVNNFHVNAHLQKYHKETANGIVLNVKPLEKFNARQDVLDGKANRKQFVLPIICAHFIYHDFSSLVCTKKFYSLANFEQHRKTVHENNRSMSICTKCKKNITLKQLKDHLDSCHNIKNYHCVRCSYGTNDIDLIKNHLVDNHPDRMPLFCNRNGTLGNNCDSSSIESTDVFTFYFNLNSEKLELLHSKV